MFSAHLQMGTGIEGLNRNKGKVFYATTALKSKLCLEGLRILNSSYIYDTRIFKIYRVFSSKPGLRIASVLAVWPLTCVPSIQHEKSEIKLWIFGEHLHL